MPGAVTSSPDAGRHLEVRPTSDSHFSWLRTRMSVERTLMSWVRTAVSMIGFGFTIVQFFEKFGDMAGVRAAMQPEMPRLLGLTLMAGGTLALLVATWQYHVLIRYLWSDAYQPISAARHHATPGYAISLVMLCIGAFAFFAVLTRLA